MPLLISRLGVMLDVSNSSRLLAELAGNPLTPAGRWRTAANRVELWSEPVAAAEPQLLAAVDLTPGRRDRRAVTMTRVTVSEAGQQLELTADRVCGLALSAAGIQLFETEPGNHPAGKSPALPASAGGVSMPDQRSSMEHYLDSTEDRELRRLHYLAGFGGLSTGTAQRYSELRDRDRRSDIRPPQDDDMVLLARQRVRPA